jgi:hypothetical protein
LNKQVAFRASERPCPVPPNPLTARPNRDTF